VDGAGGGDSGGGVRLGLTLTAPSGSAPFIPPNSNRMLAWAVHPCGLVEAVKCPVSLRTPAHYCFYLFFFFFLVCSLNLVQFEFEFSLDFSKLM
jgi:hypothetical protein